MFGVKKSFNFVLISSTYILGVMVRRNDAYTACSIKNPIADQIIDFNSKYSYKIQGNEIFNGDICYLRVTETGSQTLPSWLSDDYDDVNIVVTTKSTDVDYGLANGVVVQGNLAYVTMNFGGLQIINTTNPNNPTLSCTPTTGYATEVAVQGNLAYVMAGPNLQIINITDSNNPSTLSFEGIAGGEAEGVAVQGNLAYVVTGLSGLQIINITDPNNPSTICYDPVWTTGRAEGVAVQGNLAYVATSFLGLRIVNVTDPNNPSTLSYAPTTGFALKVAVQGNLAYVAAYSSGLQIINITDPNNPSTINYVLTTGHAVGVAVQGNLACVAAGGSGLQIINITDPNNPSTINYVPIIGGVAVQENLAYVAAGNGLQIINLRELLVSGPRPNTFIKYGDILKLTVTVADYLGNHCVDNFQITVDQLPILNNKIGNQKIFPQQAVSISLLMNNLFVGRGYLKPSIANKPSWLNLSLIPALISIFIYRNYSINDIAIDGTLAYLASEAGLLVVDISNFYSIFLTNSYLTSPVIQVKKQGATCFLANSTQLLKINTSTPARLVQSYNYEGITEITIVSNKLLISSNSISLLINQIETTISYACTLTTSSAYNGYGVGVAVQGKLAYVAMRPGGLQIINIADPNNPRTLSYVPTTGDSALGVAVKGNVAYVAAYSIGLQIINIADPNNPSTLSYVPTTGSALEVAVQGNVAYVAAYEGGLQIINITDPNNPSILSQVPCYYACGVAVQGNLAYVTAGDGGLQIINITNPNNPNILSYVPTGRVYGVAVQGNLAYVVAYEGGLQIINITDPNNPSILSQVPCYYACGVAVQGNLAYIATTVYGLTIINITDPNNPSILSYDTLHRRWSADKGRDIYVYGVAVQGNLVYVAAGLDSLIIIKIEYFYLINSNYITMFNNSVGLLATENNLVLIQLQDININILEVYPIPSIKKIEIINDLVFIIDNLEMRLISFNSLINNKKPNYLGTYNASSVINDIAISLSSNQAFIATNNGLEVVDIFSVSSPVLIGFYQTQNPVLSVSVSETTAFIAVGKSGFQILDCSHAWILSGTPAISDIGNYNLTLTATDVFEAKVNNDFSILVMDPPILTKNVSSQIAYVNKLLDFSVPMDVFNDVNNNILNYFVALANYSSAKDLPIWLTFDAFNLRFYGTPSLSDAYFYVDKILNINLTAMNSGPIGASVIFNISVRGIEEPPRIVNNISNQLAYTGKLFEFALPNNTFNDAYTMSYFAALANNAGNLPEWLTFSSSQLRFYGTPSLNDAYFYVDKVLNINLTAMNPGPVGASVIFNISVRGIERPPQIVNNVSNQVAYTGKLFDFTVPNNIFADSYPLSYSASLANNADITQASSFFRLFSNTANLQLPVWLSFDTSTLRFYGTPGMGDLNFFSDKNLKINITAINPGPIGSSVVYNLTVTGMSYGVMTSIIASSVVIAGILGFAGYRKAPVMEYALHKITNTTKCWQFDERPMTNKERKCNVYLMSEEYFDGQEPEQVAQHHAPGVIYNQYGIGTNVILNKDSSPLIIPLKENEQELLPRTVIKNHSKPKKETLKVGNPVLNLIAAKGEYYHSQEYQLISAPPDSKDFKKVLECYQHHPASGYDIKSVEIIYNPVMELAFAENLKMLQARNNNPAFMPRFLQEDESAEERELRIKTNELWKDTAARYIDSDCPDVKLLPLWHGTKPEILSSIFKAGYANLATTDCGYFGKGLYSTYEAEYSYKYYYQGALILNWVSSYSAYPVIAGDMQKLTAKGTYQNYDTNFIPVVEYTRDNKDNFVPANLEDTSDVYLPCGVGQQPLYTEIVVFERAQCLPRYLVTLQPTLVRSPCLLESEEENRMSRLLKRQEAMLSNADLEKDGSTTNVTTHEQEVQAIHSSHRRPFLFPNTPNASPLIFSSKKGFSINRESILVDENPDSPFTNKPPEPIRIPEVAYLESSSSCSCLLITATAHEDSSNSAMNRPKTTGETILNMELDEDYSTPEPLLFSAAQPAVYLQSSIVADEFPVATITTELARMSI